MANDVEEVKRRTNIVDLISSYLTLKKAGKDYKALCPFHQEKTPSFFVSPEKQIFKCFGCGEGGDIYDFVMKQEGLEFGDALKLLADRAGVTLEPRTRVDREQPGLKSRLFALNRLAALFFHKILLEHPRGKEARDYLAYRGLKPETIKEFQIGFAPAAGPTATFLTRRKFSTQEMEQAGRPDRFTRRIIFPIHDVVGNSIGFSGRALDPESQPKYLNTPETAIFKKGRLLYGLFEAKKAIKDQDQVIVVEGQMDVVASHQAGVTNIVATSGTSLTDDHLRILYRYTPNLLLAFDTDPAGEKAADRAILMALGQGFTVKLIPLTEKDPADLVKSDPKDWQKAVESAKESISYVIDRAMSKFQEPSAEQKKTIAKIVLPYLAALADPIEQETWVKTLSQKLAVSEKTIYLALAKARPREGVPVVREVAKNVAHLTPAETLVGLLLSYPDKAEKVVKELAEEELESRNLIELFQVLKREQGALKKNPAKSREHLAHILPPELGKLADFLVFSVTHEFPEEEATTALNQLVARLSNRRSEDLKRQFAAKIAAAEKAGDRESVKKLMVEFQSLIGTGK